MRYRSYERGIFLLHTDRFDEAAELFESLVAAAPDDSEAWQRLAVSYVGAGKPEMALKSAEEAVRLNPEKTDLLIFLGGIHSLLNRSEEALQAYDSAILLDPTKTRAWISKIVALLLSGRSEEAKECYLVGVETAPALRDSEDWNDVALGLYESEKYDESARVLSFLIELEPDEISYKINLLRPLTRLEKYELVLEISEEIIQEMPALPLAWVVKGVAYLGLGRYEEALGSFDRALKLDPSNRETVDLRARTREYMEEEMGEG